MSGNEKKFDPKKISQQEITKHFQRLLSGKKEPRRNSSFFSDNSGTITSASSTPSP